MSIGMAVNSGNETKKRELVALLDQASELAAELGLWIEGRPFDSTLWQIGNQLCPDDSGFRPDVPNHVVVSRLEAIREGE